MSFENRTALALVVVDVQMGLFCSSRPPFEAGAVLTRINAATAQARAAAVPVIFIQHDGPADGDWLVPLTVDWQLHPDLQIEPSDLVIRKTAGDAFYATTLERELRSRKVQTIVLLGYATDFCIDATVRNAASKDFEVIVVADAHTADNSPMLEAQQIREYFNWLWANSPSRMGIHVVPSGQLDFSPQPRP